MLFLFFLNIVFLLFPFGVLPPGDYLPAPVEPVFDALFDIPPVLETVFSINTFEASKVTDVFPPEPLPGHGQYISHLTNNHHIAPIGSLATPTGTSTIPEFIFTPMSGHDSDSSEILRLIRSDGVKFLSMRESAATDGYVDSNVLYDLKTRNLGKSPFLTYSTFEIIVISAYGCHASTKIVTGFYRATATALVGFCHAIMIGRAKLKKHRQKVQREEELVKQYEEAFEESRGHFKELCVTQQQLEMCQTELAKLQQAEKQDDSEHCDLQKQCSYLEKELAKATQEAKEQKATHVQELSETTQQKISLEADRKAQSELLDEQAQALQDKDAELVEYKAQAKKAEKLDIDLQQLQSALQKKHTELSSYKVKAHKAERERSIRDKAQETSRLKANQLKKDLAKSKEETAMYKKDMDQMKADAEAQKEHAAMEDEKKKRAFQSKLFRMEKLVDSIDNTVQKNRELVKKFEKEREERMRASPWHIDLASSDKEHAAQEDNLLETKTEGVSTVDPVPGCSPLDSDHLFEVPRQAPSPTEQSTDSGFYEEVKSSIDQAHSIVDATTIPDTFSADSILHSEDELQVKFPEKDVDISAPQETLQLQALSNLLRPEHNLEAKTMLPQGISVLQLAQTVIIRQTGSTIFVADDLRRREPWLRKEAKAFKSGSYRARRNYHQHGEAASMKALGLQFSEKSRNSSAGEKTYLQLPNFKGSRRRHSLSYGEKDSVIMAEIKDPQLPRTEAPEFPCKSAWLSDNILEEISTCASIRSGSPFDDTLHLKPIVMESHLNTVPASALLQLTDAFFTTTSSVSNQLCTIPRDDASYDEFKSARVVDIIGADNPRLMRQKLAYTKSFSSFVDNATFDKYRSTWSQAKEIRVDSFDQKCQLRNSTHPPTAQFDYSNESVQELLAATADVADEDVVHMAQKNESPKSFASDIKYLRHSGSTGIDTHYERERAQEARNTINAQSAPPSPSNPSSLTTTTATAAPSAPLAPVPQAQPLPPAFSRGVGTSQWADEALAATPPASAPAAAAAAAAAPSRSLNSSRHASVTLAPPASPAVEAENARTINSTALRCLDASRFATNNTPATSSTNAPSDDSSATTSAAPSRSLNESRWARETPTHPSIAAPSGPRVMPTAPPNGQTIPSGPRNHRGGRGYGRGGRGRAWGRGFY